MEPRFDVFLAHNSQDKASVVALAEALQAAGVAPWLDSWILTPGASWQAELAAGLHACHACAVCLGPHGLGAWAQMELHLALDRAAHDPTFRLIPVLLPGVPDPFDRTQLPPFLLAYTWVDLRGGLAGSGILDRLVAAIRRASDEGAWDGPLPPALAPAAGADQTRPAPPVAGPRVQLAGVIAALEAQRALLGDTVVATVLAHASPPGGILLAHDAYRHVRGLFDVRMLPPHTVSGMAAQVPAYFVERAKPRGFHLNARGVAGVETSMIGRDLELRQLREAFEEALEEGAARMVTVVGEAGVGKSRLLAEFEGWLDLQPQRVWYFKGRARRRLAVCRREHVLP